MCYNMSSNLEFYDIGAWQNYYNHNDKTQRDDQRILLYDTGLHIDLNNTIKYIPTMCMKNSLDELSKYRGTVCMRDIETVIEDETFYTATIEGAKTTRIRTTELHNGAPIDVKNRKSELMVLNAFKATQYLDSLINKSGVREFTMNEDIILNCWNILIDGCCENEAVRGTKYRKGHVYIGNFVPVNSLFVDNMMQGWLDFYNSIQLNDIPQIKAIILHFALELIHPFCDGNGRLGRLLMQFFLIQHGLTVYKAISPSMQIFSNVTKYYAAFTQSENFYFDCTPFLEFMLDIYVKAEETARNVQEYSFNITDYVNKPTVEKSDIYNLKMKFIIEYINRHNNTNTIESLSKLISKASCDEYGLVNSVDKAFAVAVELTSSENRHIRS